MSILDDHQGPGTWATHGADRHPEHYRRHAADRARYDREQARAADRAGAGREEVAPESAGIATGCGAAPGLARQGGLM
jgi:hypothetical protein